MNQQEFYETPEVQAQIDVQKGNLYGSVEHRAAFDRIGEIAKEFGVFDEYTKSGGGIYD